MQVEYENLKPSEFRKRLKEYPVAYLPLGTLEWHGEHMPLGADGIQSRELFKKCAERFGGIVLPSLWLGPDVYRPLDNGSALIGMDNSEFTTPNRQLDGSAYWVSEGFFQTLIDQILFNIKRAGFKAVLADGHGPSRIAWCRSMEENSRRYGIKILGITEDLFSRWRSQMDHGGLNETSLTMHYRPDLVDLSLLGSDRNMKPQGIGIDDPRDATEELGAGWMEESIELAGELLKGAGF
ncbi:MAG: creatininase family protein [Spirochaetales bacterium]|nr:creatininase family protein [Spirochaetales bacterium]